MQKRVLAIHDISCVGKCSLTVALPVISATGAECSILPTSLLSTHTGGFENYTFLDLTEEIPKIANHWQELKLPVQYIYSGYLGSFRQIDLIKELFDKFSLGDRGEKTMICVDPVMGDNGSLYALFDEEFAKGMASLCGKADLIMPNITEACYMTGIPYKEDNYDEGYVKELIESLHQLGPKYVILTGVSFDPDKLGAACSDGENISYYMEERIEGYYHGTGDVFGSSLVGAVSNGISPEKAMEIAVKYTVASIRRTKNAGTEARYGVCFEQEIPELINMINNANL